MSWVEKGILRKLAELEKRIATLEKVAENTKDPP